MNIRGSGANLAQAAKDLSIEWQQAKASWHDIKSQEFEAKFLEHLPGHIARAMAAIEDIDTLLKKVRNDCE